MGKKNGLADPSRLDPLVSQDKQLLRVIVETPKGSRNKFAFNPDEHTFELKKVLPAGMAFPYDFGFVPSTKGDDGDPIDVLVLMDEPASALDPISTAKIEDLIFELKKEYTVVIVTHNMQQAARVADFTAFFLMGNMVELDKTETMFTKPSDKRTEDYITGRFG